MCLNSGLNIDYSLPEISVLVEQYTAYAGRVDRLIAPPSILDGWKRTVSTTQKRHGYIRKKTSEKSRSMTTLSSSVRRWIGFWEADDTIKEYLRINCLVNFG